MNTKSFINEIDKGLAAPAYLLYANSDYLLEESLSMIKKALPESEVDFNFNVFDIDSADERPTPEQIINTLKTVSFFGKRRYVIVKNLQKITIKDFKKFQDYIIRPSPDAVMIMLHVGTLRKELRENLKLIKAICLDISEQHLPAWIKEKANEKGLLIKNDAIEYLIGIVGADIGLLSSEIEKLTLLGDKHISINNIRETVEGNRDYGVFELTQALRERKTEQAFKIYRVISETMEPYKLLGAINWLYSQMFIKAPAAQKDYYQKAFELLNEADIQIKTSGGTYPVEHLLVKLLKL